MCLKTFVHIFVLLFLKEILTDFFIFIVIKKEEVNQRAHNQNA